MMLMLRGGRVIVSLLVLFVVVFSIMVFAESSESSLFFEYYDSSVFTAMKVFNPDFAKKTDELSGALDVRSVPEMEFAPVKKSNQELLRDAPAAPIIVEIAAKEFVPQEVRVVVGQKVVWQNARPQLSALLLGLREITTMRSGFIEPGETFSWSFSEPGEYTYADGVVVGTTGKIVVE